MQKHWNKIKNQSVLAGKNAICSAPRGGTMNIDFVNPLSRGWGRMKKALFQPFNLKKWFVVGFTVFLAELTEGPNGNGTTGIHEKRHGDFGDVINFPGFAWEWLMNHPFWFGLIIIGIVCFIAFIILLTWLSSRGKFMFLDNVVYDRALVVNPWYEFRMHGNSLFLWRLGFGLICLGIIVLLLVAGFILAANIYHQTLKIHESVLLGIGLGLVVLAAICIIAYISMFLNNFIVPIMYKNGIKTTQAWQHFLQIFSRYPFHFILYGLFLLVLYIVVVIAVIIAGFLTCCIGLFLLMIPYINAVVLLPISYTFRAYSVEFLEQFGPEFKIFPE